MDLEGIGDQKNNSEAIAGKECKRKSDTDLDSEPKCAKKPHRLTRDERKTLEEQEDMSVSPVITLRDGLRCIKPFFFNYRCNAKARWYNNNRTVEDIFTSEFHVPDTNYVRAAFKMGRITCNTKRIAAEHLCKDGDHYVHRCHKHELPVLNRPIKVIEEDDNFLVVDKPPSIPMHPTGKYFHNSLTKILQNDMGYSRTDLRIMYRIDRAVSGLVVLSKNAEIDRKLKKMIVDRSVEKIYLALVDGVFPESDLECTQPILVMVKSIGIQCAHPDGKASVTRFSRVWTDGVRSVVRCVPKTGRTHQIRIHLQYLGYPIVNDALYNTLAFGPGRGKNADYGKSMEQLVIDVKKEHSHEKWMVNDQDPEYLQFRERLSKIADGDEEEISRAEERTTEDYDPICAYCHCERITPPLKHLEMYLHCLQYTFGDRTFASDPPEWACKPDGCCDTEKISVQSSG